MRKAFYFISIVSVLLICFFQFFWIHVHLAWLIVLPFIALGLYDLNSGHNILINYPVVGHFRYMFEFVRPEIQQYFINTNQSGRPFNREIRSLIYQRAKGERDTLPFGTQRDITDTGYEFVVHSIAPKDIKKEDVRVTVGGLRCQKPYSASILNISAMSFGALSPNAILALNKGAKQGGFAHNTGEGGLSNHHIEGGGDLIWQIGTGYFGCRHHDGSFNPEKFKKRSQLDVVKMIEIKLSQGAKPAHGGILPGAKVNEEIAAARDIPLGEDCISPPMHSTFSDPKGLLNFVEQLRDLSGGKPVGFKCCIGKRSEFMAIVKAMLETGICPDFITIDGAEGGTGAAPLEFSNRLGLPINDALIFVHQTLIGAGLRDHIRLIASGKVATGFDLIQKQALGADMCNSARGMMFTLGCIQALKCNTNECPTGVTTMDPQRGKALIVERKYPRVARYHEATIDSFLDILGAMGYEQASDLTAKDIFIRVSQEKTVSFAERYTELKPKQLLGDDIPAVYLHDWHNARAESF